MSDVKLIPGWGPEHPDWCVECKCVHGPLYVCEFAPIEQRLLKQRDSDRFREALVGWDGKSPLYFGPKKEEIS